MSDLKLLGKYGYPLITNGSKYYWDYPWYAKYTLNGGETWHDMEFSGLTTNKPNPRYLSTLAYQQTSNGGTVNLKNYILFSAYNLTETSEKGVYISRSDDEGITWKTEFHANFGAATKCSIVPNNSDVMYLGCWTSVADNRKSTDGGKTWSVISGLDTNHDAVDYFDVSDDGKCVYGGYMSNGVIAVSHDGGSTWTTKTATGIDSYLKVLTDSTGKYVLGYYSGTVGGTYNQQVCLSTDSGNTFTTYSNTAGADAIMSRDAKVISYVDVDNYKIKVSTDYGSTYTTYDNPWSGNTNLYDARYVYNVITKMIYLFLPGTDKLYRINIAGDLELAANLPQNISYLYISKFGRGMCFVTSNTDELWFSYNGIKWKKIYEGDQYSVGSINIF